MLTLKLKLYGKLYKDNLYQQLHILYEITNVTNNSVYAFVFLKKKSHCFIKAQAVSSDPPPLWGPQSEIMGSAVVSLLQRDPRKFEVVVGRLHGRQLPGTLRTYIWADVLFKAERQKMKEV